MTDCESSAPPPCLHSSWACSCTATTLFGTYTIVIIISIALLTSLEQRNIFKLSDKYGEKTGLV